MADDVDGDFAPEEKTKKKRKTKERKAVDVSIVDSLFYTMYHCNRKSMRRNNTLQCYKLKSR